MIKWKLLKRSQNRNQSRCSSSFSLGAVIHWSCYVLSKFIEKSKFVLVLWLSFLTPTQFNTAPKRIELQKWDWSQIEALYKGFYSITHFLTFDDQKIEKISLKQWSFFCSKLYKAPLVPCIRPCFSFLVLLWYIRDIQILLCTNVEDPCLWLSMSQELVIIYKDFLF